MPLTSLMMRVAHAAEEGGVERIDVGGHAVGAGDGAQGADVVVGAPVAHHADGLDRQQHREGLPDRVVQPGVADFFEIDRIGLAQDVAAFLGDFAGNADREAGAGEGMAADEDCRAGRVRGPVRGLRP